MVTVCLVAVEIPKVPSLALSVLFRIKVILCCPGCQPAELYPGLGSVPTDFVPVSPGGGTLTVLEPPVILPARNNLPLAGATQCFEWERGELITLYLERLPLPASGGWGGLCLLLAPSALPRIWEAFQSGFHK